MPSTITSEQFHSDIKRIAGRANAFAALLSVFDLLPLAEQPGTLSMLADFAGELARDLAAIVGGAA